MLKLDFWLLLLAFAGLVLGGWGVLWARAGRVRGQVLAGRALFLGALLFLAASSLVAAFHQADGLVPLGLAAGALVTLMLWEAPAAIWLDADVRAVPEEA